MVSGMLQGGSMLSLWPCGIQNMLNILDTLKKKNFKTKIINLLTFKMGSGMTQTGPILSPQPSSIKNILNLLDTLKKEPIKTADLQDLQNHPFKGVHEVPDICDGVRDDSNWSHIVNTVMWNSEHAESP